MGRDGFWRRFGKRTFVSEKNIREHVIVCVKIVAEFAHVLLGGCTEQYRMRKTEYSYSFITSILIKLNQKREKQQHKTKQDKKQTKKWADLCKAKSVSMDDFFDLGFAAKYFHCLYKAVSRKAVG